MIASQSLAVNTRRSPRTPSLLLYHELFGTGQTHRTRKPYAALRQSLYIHSTYYVEGLLIGRALMSFRMPPAGHQWKQNTRCEACSLSLRLSDSESLSQSTHRSFKRSQIELLFILSSLNLLRGLRDRHSRRDEGQDDEQRGEGGRREEFKGELPPLSVLGTLQIFTNESCDI
jgi:hypothetical protein